MSILENIEKLRCLKLQRQKEQLQEKLNHLKRQSFINFLNEQPMMAQNVGGHPLQNIDPKIKSARMKQLKQGISADPNQQPLMPGQDPMTGFSLKAQYGIPDPELAAQKRQGGVAALKKAQQPTQQWDMAIPLQGFALTPQSAEAQEELLTKWYDNPDVPGRQAADKPSWQNLQTATQNWQRTRLDQLLRSQRMLG
jgi:hypothetical protein